jgi:hypothetical protein
MTSQPPAPGSQRDIRARLVRTWLTRHTGFGKTARYTYQGIQKALAPLSIQAVQKAVYDLRDHYPEDPLIVSVPSAANGWTVEVGWRSAAMYGMANQLRHLTTRDNSEANLLERAADLETDPSLAFLYRNEAAQARSTATRHQNLVTHIQSVAKTRATAEGVMT